VICKAAPRGARVRGLVEYLFGPGRSDQHTDQHVIAAYDDVLVGDTGQTELGRVMLAAELDFPRRAFAPEVTEGHVYHVALSSKGGVDRDLTDDEWRQVAEATADRLGFTAGGEGAVVRWVAVRHGHSSAGNDHIHLVANLVREDGRTHHFARPDWTVLREVATEVETRLGLTMTGVSKTGTPGMSRLEVQTQRATRLESPRERLRRGVRASATAARTESEFVGLLRAEGLVVRPRWAAGGRDTVVGYSVARATTPGAGDELVWFGGGKLGRDLTLPALRQAWEPDPDAATAWRAVDPASRAGQRGVGPTSPAVPGRAAAPSPEVLTEAAVRLQQVTAQLGAVPLHDRAAWSAIARDTAGVLAALSQRVGGAEGLGLVKAAHSMSRAVVREPRSHVPASPHAVSLSQVARASLTVAAASRGGSAGTVILLTQLVALSRAVAEAQRAAGRLAQAQAALDAVQHARTSLDVLGGPRALPEPVKTAAAGAALGDGHRKSPVELLREAMGPGGRRPAPGVLSPPGRAGPGRRGPVPPRRDRDDDLGR